MKNEKKTTLVFLYIKYSKLWSISLEHFVKHKYLISEECGISKLAYKNIKILEFFLSSYLKLVWQVHFFYLACCITTSTTGCRVTDHENLPVTISEVGRYYKLISNWLKIYVPCINWLEAHHFLIFPLLCIYHLFTRLAHQ